MAHDNAASRLLDLLVKAKSIDKNTVSINAWEQLLQTKSNPALLLSRMGKMIALPEQITTLLTNSVDTSPEVVQHISNQFYTAFSSHRIIEKWESFSTRIDSHIINYLSLASKLLETQVATKKIEHNDIVKLREDLVQIIEKFRTSDLPQKLKIYIVRQLHYLILALDDYFIAGAEPILERIEATICHTAVDDEYKNFLTSHELGKTFLDCLVAAASLVTVAVGLPQLTQTFQLLLQNAN
jgi:hypothetical protein